jgi:superfamily II DNA or RNA helicase
MVLVNLKDGLLEITNPPGFLERELSYNKSEFNVRTRKMVFHREQLYTEEIRGNDRVFITMPGFAHRVMDCLRKAGIQFDFKDTRTPFPEPDYNKAIEGARDYQIEIIYNMLAARGGILESSTGSGKTAMTAAIIKAFDKEQWKLRGTPLSVFACPAKDINRKNAEELTRFIPGREVGCVMSGTTRWSDDIICITLDSLHLLDPNDVGLLVVDEMHTLAADTRAEALSKFMKAMRYGVSATPEGRSDGRDIVSEGLLGPVVIRRTYADMVAAGALVPIEVLWLPLPEPSIGLERYNRYKLREKKVEYAIEQNTKLSQTISDILRSTKPEIQVLCMAQHIEQISNIHQLCDPDVKYMHADTSFRRTDRRTGQTYVVTYPTVGPVSSAQRKQMYDMFRSGEVKKIIASGAWSTGVDFPKLDVVINSYGAASDILTKQVSGRASRKSDGKDVAYIVEFWPAWDVEDANNPRSKPGPNLRAAQARKKSYKELGFKQTWLQNLTEIPFLDKELVKTTATWRARPITPMERLL